MRGQGSPLSDAILPGLAFLALSLLFATGAVQASGYLPLAGRPAALQGPLGLPLVLLLLAALALLLAAALAFAAARLDWPVAVVAGGLGLLGGPLAWQGLQPLRLDRPAGLVLTILAAAAAAAAAHWL